MNFFRADLHCHSTCSDGTLTPSQLIQLAVDLNLQGLAITDHDTVSAYDEAIKAAESAPLKLISGVEFSSALGSTPIHILGYSFPLNSPEINELCQRHSKRRLQRNQAILDLLAKQGMPIGIDELKEDNPHSIVGRPHIALAMMKKGYVTSIQEAFHLYIGESKPCYSAGEKIGVEETIDIIHRAGGLAIIAHPHLIDEVGTVKQLLEMNFDGLEGYYARFLPSAHERWLKIAAKKNWIVTGGSDFHGTIKPTLPLGASWVNEETFNLLHAHFLKNQEKI